jgi:sugar O-acyltransferase (sialic acid O-acetyltransferase NeuD family)
MNRAVVIWGCGGFAREVNMLCDQLDIRVHGFLDERPHMKGVVVDGVPVLGVLDDVRSLRQEVGIVSAGVGDPELRRRFAALVKASGFAHAEPIVHPAVHVSRHSTIGLGSVVCAGVNMTVNVRIGCHVIVNLNSTIGHDVRIEDFTTLSPGVNISGNVSVGEGVYIGTNAAVRERLRIGARSVVGGGAFVMRDVPERVLVAGVPAEVKKSVP